jgi:cation:H+ antiporter
MATPMDIILNFTIFIMASFFILTSTNVFVKGAVEVSAALKLSKVFVGATLVSLITTTPEFVVSLSSSYVGESGIAVGSVIGSCICNIGLIFGIGAITRDITGEREDLKYRVAFLLAALVIVYLVMLDGVVSREDAAVMVVLLILFLIYNYRLAIQSRRRIEQEIAEIQQEETATPRSDATARKGLVLLLFGGVVTVLLARYGLVYTGLNIAMFFSVPPIVIGLSLLAIGTSLPELFTAFVSSRAQHGEIALGNVIGANTLNLFGVLGVAALVRPLTVDAPTLVFSMPVAIFITLVMLVLGGKMLQFSRKAGCVLLAIYITYIAVIVTLVYR